MSGIQSVGFTGDRLTFDSTGVVPMTTTDFPIIDDGSTLNWHYINTKEGEASEEDEVVYRDVKPRIRKQDGKKPIVFQISNEELDRYGTVIRADGINLENFKRNPVVLWNHGSGYMGGSREDDVPVARASNIYVKNKQLFAELEFDQGDEFAVEIERKIRDGFLNAASIGFIPRRIVRGETVDEPDEIVEAELVEFSIVSVPANPSALVVSRNLRGQLQQALKEVEEVRSQLDGNKILVDREVYERLMEYHNQRQAEVAAPEVPSKEAASDAPSVMRVDLDDLRTVIAEMAEAKREAIVTEIKKLIGRA